MRRMVLDEQDIAEERRIRVRPHGFADTLRDLTVGLHPVSAPHVMAVANGFEAIVRVRMAGVVEVAAVREERRRVIAVLAQVVAGADADGDADGEAEVPAGDGEVAAGVLGAQPTRRFTGHLLAGVHACLHPN